MLPVVPVTETLKVNACPDSSLPPPGEMLVAHPVTDCAPASSLRVGFAPLVNDGGSFTLFSGVAAAKIAVGTLAVAITNGAVDILARSLALELAPIRVNAISPGVIDTGAWDEFGEQGKAAYFDGIRSRNPARRIGTTGDIADGVLFAITSPFLTGTTLHVDGGEPLT